MALETTILSDSEESTIRIGVAMGSVLVPGDVVALSGDLGSGKTTLVKGMAKALGSDETVSSPTFPIVQRYRGRTPLNHVDLYRIRDREELADLDYDLLFGPDSISVVEWADRFEDVLPHACMVAVLEHAGPSSRRITLSADIGEQRLADLRKKLEKIRKKAPPASGSRKPMGTKEL